MTTMTLAEYISYAEKTDRMDLVPVAMQVAKVLSDAEVQEAFANRGKLSPAASDAVFMLWYAKQQLANPADFT